MVIETSWQQKILKIKKEIRSLLSLLFKRIFSNNEESFFYKKGLAKYYPKVKREIRSLLSLLFRIIGCKGN